MAEQGLLERFGLIATALRKAVTDSRIHGMSEFLMRRVHAQIGRIARLLPQAFARADWPIRQRPPRPYVPREPTPLAHPLDGWRRLHLPRREAWLIRIAPRAANVYAGHLQHMLAEPEMAALAATPRAHRLLRPLCRMLGISDCLPPLAAPGEPPATPTLAALRAKPPPPSPPVADTWQTCAMASPAISHIWPPYKILPTT